MKTIPGDDLIKRSERRVFLFTTQLHVILNIGLMSSVLMYNVENSKVESDFLETLFACCVLYLVPLTSALAETLLYYEDLTPEKRGTVQTLMSGQCHPQLEGLQGTSGNPAV